MLFMSDKQNKSYWCTFVETSSLISMLQLLCAVALVRLRKTSSIRFNILPLSLWVNVSDGLTSQMFKLYLKLQFVVSGSPGRNVAPASPSRTVEMFIWYEWHATNLNICDTAGAKKCTLETFSTCWSVLVQESESQNVLTVRNMINIWQMKLRESLVRMKICELQSPLHPITTCRDVSFTLRRKSCSYWKHFIFSANKSNLTSDLLYSIFLSPDWHEPVWAAGSGWQRERDAGQIIILTTLWVIDYFK